MTIIFVLAEYNCRYQSTFGIKKIHIEQTKQEDEILILGTSHAQNALNPDFITKKSANLAFAGQTIEINYFLLEKYINQMPNLKMVVFEVSPHAIYMKFDEDEGNGHAYANLYDIFYKVSPYSIKNYSFLFSNFKFFSGIYFDYINPYGIKYIIDKNGFIVNDYYDRFYNLNYDTKKIEDSFVMNHGFNRKDLLPLNKLYINKAKDLCQKKGVKLLFITTPFYESYEKKIPEEAKEDMQNIFDGEAKIEIKYADFSKDKNFTVRDFKNDNHLNPDGAKKFTLKINELINSLLNN